MTVNELIEALEEHREMVGGDAEVRLMTQRNWPFENTIYGVTNGEIVNDYDDGEESNDDDDEDVEDDKVVYICEGDQLGYGSKRAWDSC